MKPSKSDPLGLFLHAHVNGACEAERCLGVVEKLLLESRQDSLLLGCKAALLLIVQSESGLAENEPLYRRKSLQIAQDALDRARPLTALKIRLINGLAWARLENSDTGRGHALAYLQVFEEADQVDHIPPLIMLEGLVALAIAYEDNGRQTESVERFIEACKIDRKLASNRYELFRTIKKRGQDGRKL